MSKGFDPKWDFEFSKIISDLNAIFAQYPPEDPSSFKEIDGHAKHFERVSYNLLSDLDHIRTISKKTKDFETHSEASFYYWVTRLCDKIKNYTQIKSRLLTKMMWLKLIDIRTASEYSLHATAVEIQPDRVVELTLKQAQLTRIEERLNRAMESVTYDQNLLKRRHLELQVYSTNFEASQCFSGKLGNSVAEALQSPSIRALQYLFRRILIGVQFSSEDIWIQRVTQELLKKSKGLLNKCKKVVLSGALFNQSKPKVTDNDGTFIDLKGELERICELDHKLKTKYQALFSTPISAIKCPIAIHRSQGHRI